MGKADGGARKLREAKAEVRRLRKALIPFARIWAMCEGLGIDPARPVAECIAGAWPRMADAKHAYELAWRYRKRGQ